MSGEVEKELSDGNQVAILHLSDLHFSQEDLPEIKIILDALSVDLEDLNKEYGVVPNIIVISGDIANTCVQSDYQAALEWLKNFTEKLGICPERVFIVPGNHDVNRKNLRDLTTLKLNDENDVTRFLIGEKEERRALFRKFDKFYKFAKDFYGENNPYRSKYYLSKVLQVNEYKIGIVGLNSSWYSGETKYEDGKVFLDQKKLIVGEYQAREAFDSLIDTNIIITILHHPFSWLEDFDEGIVKRIVTEKSNIVFHGHIHSAYATEISDPDTKCLVLSAGASNRKGRNKRYSLYTINLEDFSYEVYLRLFSDEKKFWAKDALSYRRTDGIFKGRLYVEKNESEELSKVYPFGKPNQEIEKFVAKELNEFVLNEEYDKRKILELRRAFFHKTKLNPSFQDIAINTVKYLIENKMIQTCTELKNIISSSPFLKKNLKEFDRKRIFNYFDDEFFEKQSEEIVFTKREEIAKLKERKFLSEKQRELQEKIEERLRKDYEKRVEELEDRTREINKEYEIFASKIDNYRDMENVEIPRLEVEKPIHTGRWYEELGLRRSPFPSHIGLEGFDEKLYEDIIVKTEIFRILGDEIKESPESIRRRSYLIMGVMGSGKTTLFKYLQNIASVSKPKIFTIFIPLKARSSFEEISYDFYQKLYGRLEENYFSSLKAFPGTEKQIINDSTISYLFRQIRDYSTINHFIIFIDDLHKHLQYTKQVFEFISELQIFRSSMYESKIDLTIYISGDIAWISDSDGVKSLTGSIDVKEVIPAISIENAVDMINRRLKVLAKYQKNPPMIRRFYVERIFKILLSRIPTEITFRDVMEEVEKHWMNFEFKIPRLSLSRDSETLWNMLFDLKSDHANIKFKLDKIWEYSQEDKITFSKFADILEKLYLEKGVSETAYEFTENEEFFGSLFTEGLISKRKKELSFVWTLNWELRRFFLKYQHKYGFLPSEYLPNLYAIQKVGKRYFGEESARMSVILRVGRTYGESFLRYMKDALSTYRMMIRLKGSKDHEIKELVDLSKESISCLMKATLVVCEKREVIKGSLYDINEEFIDSWFGNPDLTEFVDAIQQKETKETEFTSSDLNEILNDYFRAIKTTISDLRRFMKYNTIFTLDLKYLYGNDKKVLNRARRNFYNRHYAFALDTINSLMVIKLRNILHAVTCINLGTKRWKQGLPSEMQHKLTTYAGDFPEDKSVLNRLKLTELTQMCLHLDDTIDKILSISFGVETWLSIKDSLFREVELQKVHRRTKVNRGKREKALKYILQAKELVEKIDSFYYMLFLDQVPFPMNYKEFCISGKFSYKYRIDKNITEIILSKLDEDKKLELDFSKYIPHPSFQSLNFVDWIMYIYNMNLNIRKLTFDQKSNGKIVISI